MAQHPLIEMVLHAYKDHDSLDGLALACFLWRGGEHCKSKERRAWKAYQVVAEHLLESMLEDGILRRDAQGWYQTSHGISMTLQAGARDARHSKSMVRKPRKPQPPIVCSGTHDRPLHPSAANSVFFFAFETARTEPRPPPFDVGCSAFPFPAFLVSL